MRARTLVVIVALLLVSGVVSAQNLVPLPTFPSTYLTQWTATDGVWTHATGAGNDTNGGDGSGACTATEGAVPNGNCIITSACIPVAASTLYGYGVKMKHGGNVTGINLYVYEHVSGDCTDAFVNTIGNTGFFFPPTGWTTYNATATTTASAGSVWVEFTMTAAFGSGNTIIPNVDWGFFGVGLVPVEIQSFTVE